MVGLGLAHVGAHRRLVERDAAAREGFDQRRDRRTAAEVHHRAGPVENHQVETAEALVAHRRSPPNKSATTSSPIAKPVDAPAPVVTITSRTCGAGASITTG